MASAVLGKVSPTPKGEYVSTQDYDRLDVVTYEGYPYLAKSNVPSGNLPTDELYWMPLLTGLDFAPGGYGLGVPSLNTEFINTTAKLDALGVNRWYIFTGGADDPIVVSGTTITYAWGRVDTYNDNNLIMTLHAYAPSELKNRMCELVRYKVEGVWSQWEWTNPPMQLGVEYRTTERWNGNPVYTQLVECGSVTNGAEIAATVVAPSSPLCIRYGGNFGSITIPYNQNNPSATFYAAASVERSGEKTLRITLHCGPGPVGQNAKIQIWYW